MAAYRCSMCSENWPAMPAYRRCPNCDEVTNHMTNANAIDDAEAAKHKAHADFERYLEKTGRA